MKEAYCSNKIADLLKEKGMPEDFFWHYQTKCNDDGTRELITTCTHQSAYTWLREKNIGILPRIHITQDPREDYWGASIVYLDKSWDIIYYVSAPSEDLVKGYDDVVEQALEYILKNLI